MTDAITSLIERLEGASEGSRELDYAIKEWLEPIDPYWALRVAADWTSSIDAALALAKRALPEMGTINLCIAGSAEVTIEAVDPCADYLAVNIFGRTPALALCIAILKAKQSS